MSNSITTDDLGENIVRQACFDTSSAQQTAPCPHTNNQDFTAFSLMQQQVSLSGEQVQRQKVVPKTLMVVEVFIAGGNTEDTLSEHSSLLVSNEELVARVGDTAIYGVDKADRLVNFPQQHCTGVGGSENSMKYAG